MRPLAEGDAVRGLILVTFSESDTLFCRRTFAGGFDASFRFPGNAVSLSGPPIIPSKLDEN